MARRKRRTFSAQFKADAVRLVTAGGKTIAEVTKQFDLTETALREWVRRSEVDAGRGPPDALTTAERAELIERALLRHRRSGRGRLHRAVEVEEAELGAAKAGAEAAS